MRQGFKVEAVRAAVDEALIQRLHALARRDSITVKTKAGGTRQPSEINKDLLRTAVYDRWVAAQVTAWLETRNKVIHGEAANVDQKWIGLMLEGIGLFLREHPAA